MDNLSKMDPRKKGEEEELKRQKIGRLEGMGWEDAAGLMGRNGDKGEV